MNMSRGYMAAFTFPLLGLFFCDGSWWTALVHVPESAVWLVSDCAGKYAMYHCIVLTCIELSKEVWMRNFRVTNF